MVTSQTPSQARPGNRNAEGNRGNPAPEPVGPVVSRLCRSFGSFWTWRGFSITGDSAKHRPTGGVVSAPYGADSAAPYRARVDGETTFHKTPEAARDAIHAALRRRDDRWRRSVAANPLRDPRVRPALATVLEDR